MVKLSKPAAINPKKDIIVNVYFIRLKTMILTNIDVTNEVKPVKPANPYFATR